MTPALLTLTLLSVLSAEPADVHERRRVAFGDLDLSSGQGAAIFDERVRTAGRLACRPPAPGLVDLDCLRRFRRDVVRALPQDVRREYLQALEAPPRLD
ncbi:UrcA family protein [[Roseibacterium] beibuensis]|uniref:UrcA family protein n=1 Tax=[Roseibacterium] beibuensis TaxID=1193142 RepID=UPI0038677BDC